jgi:predicted CXXCH cytochrome family protein
MSPRLRITVGIVVGAGVLLAITYASRWRRGDRLAADAGANRNGIPPPPVLESNYVGSESCAGCHRSEYDKWKGSHHALAMQPANEQTVLGDFGGASIEVNGKRWRFFRRDGKYMVSAEGPTGKMQDYQVAFTFGVDPLQQYLIPFPGGRMQALSVAWDTGARRWFYLNPGQNIPASDWLHWTRPGQTWNAMCADCHSTNLQKGYDYDHDSFKTSWSEVSVGCEACHGPGSAHAVWAAKPPSERSGSEDAALLVHTSQWSNRDQVAQCAACHARRAQFADQGRPGAQLLDRYLPGLLAAGVFHADGQIEAEDYEYHSFTQSKMYANGVRCSDCHDVHSGRLRAQGNAVCTRCHDATRFDTVAHHHHTTGPGSQCVSCHMPGQNYMVVHFRRDHSLRVPRPDVSMAVGSPIACRQPGCHSDQSESWTVQKFETFWGKDHGPHYGPILAAGRIGGRESEAGLAELAEATRFPVVVRASALDLLGNHDDEVATAALERALADPEPLIRETAATRLPTTDPQRFVQRLAPLLSDPVRAVRSQAAARLGVAPPEILTTEERKAFDRALAGYIEDQRYMADLPSGAFNLGNLYSGFGFRQDAEKQYRRALQVDDQLYPAKVNLAMLLAQEQRGPEAEKLLREVHQSQPQLADVSFDLALLLVEEGKRSEAERALRAALAANPRHAAAAYNLAVIVGERDPLEASKLAAQAVSERPDEERYTRALAYYRSRAGLAPPPDR